MSAPRHPMRSNPAFGLRLPVAHARAISEPSGLTSDLRLFLVSFLGGLVFMTVYLA